MSKCIRRLAMAGLLAVACIGSVQAEEKVVFANYGGLVSDFYSQYCAPPLKEKYGITLEQVAISDPLGQLKVQQNKSTIGCKKNQRDTLRSLGLKRIGDVVVKEDRPEFRGMVHTVRHLVTVTVIEGEVE